MGALLEQFDLIQQFIVAGGAVLPFILLVSVVLWFLVVERLLFFKFHYPSLRDQWLQEWHQRNDKSSKHARNIRLAMISQASMTLQNSLPLIKMLVAVCPLIGLLGTVTGMIHVFDVMAVTGNGNPRAMADGVSQATIPTMAGMVIAIGGLYFNRLLEERANEEIHRLSDLLQNH